MKKFIAFVLCTFLVLPQAFAATFSDVPESHSYYAAIESLKNLEIINGYSDGTFKPEGGVNRAEALKMILLSADIVVEESVADSGFPDIATSDWYATYAVKAKALNIVKGDGQTGNFVGARSVNKAEFIKMLLQAFEIDLSQHQNLTAGVSADTSPSDWFLPYMSYAKTIGIISPTLENNLLPQKNLTRGECAEIIYKLLVVERGGDAQKMLNVTESHLVNALVELAENDIEKALASTNSAVFYSEQAMALAPNEGIAKAANKIARGFHELCLAYKAGLDGDNDGVRNHVEEAKRLAGEAYADDPSTQTLGKKLKEQGDVLLSQIE